LLLKLGVQWEHKGKEVVKRCLVVLALPLGIRLTCGCCVPLQVLLPYSQGALLDELHKMGQVNDTQYTEAGTLLTASVPRCLVGKLQRYAVGCSSSDEDSSSGDDSSSSSSSSLWSGSDVQGEDGSSWQQQQQQLPPGWMQDVPDLVLSRSVSSSSNSSMSSL